MRRPAAGGDAGLRLDFVFDELGPQLHALRMALLQALPDAAGRRAAHAFVEQLCKLQPGLRQAAQQLFGAPGGLRAPRWRGLYLTAAPSEAGGGAFITDLFGRFLPADQPLAR
jgi:type VI secretion system protein ImpL